MKPYKTFIPYGRQWIDDSDRQAVQAVIDSDFLTQGPKINEFEEAICRYTGAKYCVILSNGTAALHLAVNVLNLNKNCNGITSPITFAASANCMAYNDVLPIFADIDEKTLNIDPEQIIKKITSQTKLLIPVHFRGQVCDMEKISDIAKKHELFVIEDAAHAIGSSYPDGSKVGNCKYSDITIFSFHPVKTITTGEGGAITTNNKDFYDRLILLRTHGITKELLINPEKCSPWYYEMQTLGYNYRITDLQAALGISQLEKIDKFKRRRQQIIDRYNEVFSNAKDIKIPICPPELDCCLHLYVLQIDFENIGYSRKECIQKLLELNIGTQVHYIPVYHHPYYQKVYGYQEGLTPIAEDYYKKALTIPLYPKMKDTEVEFVIQVFRTIIIR